MMTDTDIDNGLKLEMEIMREDARCWFYRFLDYKDPAYRRQWFHRAIADHCQMLLEGRIRNLMVFLPPQHGKSTVVSEAFPAWALGRDPDLKIVGSSYAASLATKVSRNIQRIIDSPEYAALFPDTYLNGSSLRTTVRGYLRNVDIFETVGHRGFYKAIGEGWRSDIDSLPVETVITPYRITDSREQVETLMTANGNRPLMSQRESIEQYGQSEDVDRTLREIADQEKADTFSLTD